MNSSKWDRIPWLDDARAILQWTGGISPQVPLTLLVRHSHRLDFEKQEELLHMQLTSLGQEMAVEFGSRLPKGRKLDVFHSEHPRCKETALRIIEGYERGGQIATDHGCIRELLGPFVKTSIGNELIEYGIDDFINRWARGDFPKEQIEPLNTYAARLWGHIVSSMFGPEPNRIYLNVTHDLVLMSLRKGMLGTQASLDNWIPFLGGFSVFKSGESWSWYEKGTVQRLEKNIAGTI